jgi:hypothetical protein
MTNPTTLLALAERCEQAAGPDRELDVAIARALGWKPLYRDDYSQWWPPAAVADARERKRSILHHPTQPLPMFTASLDAAVTLVPEGYYWQAANGKRRHSEPQACADLFVAHGPTRGDMSFTVDAATPALALCAAALRARAAAYE